MTNITVLEVELVETGTFYEGDNMEKNNKTMLDFIAESWRFSKLFAQAIAKLSAEEQRRYSGRLDWYSKQLNKTLEHYGYKFVEPVGEAYNPGMPLTPLNIDEFATDEQVVIAYMMEPIIMDKAGNVIKAGTAVLRRQKP